MAQPERPMMISDCPRCSNRNVTLDILAANKLPGDVFETFVRCRNCCLTSIFALYNTRSDTSPMTMVGLYIQSVFTKRSVVIAIPDAAPVPEYTPVEIAAIFREATTCMAMGCFDASGAMFRKVLDAATRSLLPPQPANESKDHPNFVAWKRRKDLALRLEWLFENDKLPKNLLELADCVREDGNDAAHASIGLSEAEARDLEDFTVVLLESVFTLPGQVEVNKARRQARRSETAA